MESGRQWFSELEARAIASADRFMATGDESDRLLHELQVHRIELEMQNDELVTSQVELENTLARHRTILAAAPMGHLAINGKGRIDDVDPTAARLLGRTKAGLTGRHLQGFLSTADADRLHLCLQDSQLTDRPQTLDVAFTPEASPEQVRLYLVPNDAGAAHEDFGCFVFMSDLSEQIASHQRVAEEKLALATQLVHGISARYDRLLEGLNLGFEGMVRRMSAAGLQPGRVVAATHETLRQAMLLSSQLRALSVREELPEALDATTVVSEMVASVRDLLGEHIALIIDPSAHGCRVRAPRPELASLVFHLCVRALETKHSTTALRLSREDLHGDLLHDGAKHGAYLKLSMTGGMDRMAMERYQQAPFARGNPDLASLASIVDRCAGFIDLRGDSDSGLRIEVYLPMAPHWSAALPPAEPAAPTQQRVVLLVDDDASVRKALSRILRLEGFDVLIAEDGEGALRVAANEEQRIDLLLTDVRMPKMNGADLGRRMSELRPELPRIYMSGDLGGSSLEAGATLIRKPFLADELVELLNGTLRSR